jgi:hypothetical protein
MLNSKETFPPETDQKCSPSEKLIRQWISDYCSLLITNFTKTQRNDTVTGATNTNGSGILDEPSLTLGSKVKYVAPPVYNVKGPALAGFENTNRVDTITGLNLPPGKVEGILAERGDRYGDFKDHAYICQSLKLMIEEFLKEYKPSRTLAADQKQALDVICDKLARIINGDEDYVDNWDDIAGYATLVSKRITKNAR